MKKLFSYSRKVVIGTQDPYRPVSYEHGMTVEYNQNDLDENTIIDEQEYRELASMVDKAQRRTIKDEMGVEEIPMDQVKESLVKKKKRIISR